MLFPPTVGQTLGTHTVGQPVDLSPLVNFYRSSPRYPQFRSLTNAQFAGAYGLRSVQTSAQELAAANWFQTSPGKWQAPKSLCDALQSEFCPIEPLVPGVQIPRQAPPTRPQPSLRQAPTPEQTWVEWFWSWFGF